MSAVVFFAVLGAAILHATWNALLKSGVDKSVGMVAVTSGHVPFALAALAFVPAPDPASWPYIGAGLVFHFGYQMFLLNAYRFGDFTQVYPVARGSAPLIVAAVSVLVLGVHLDAFEALAVIIIASGILSVALVRAQDGHRNGGAALLALGTGCFIAGYSLIDGMGARAAGSSVGFYAWESIGNAVVFALFMRVTRPGTLRQLASGSGRRMFLIGGGASFAAYAIVTWAFTQAPIALVTALRETSIVFALVIGVAFMGERISLGKIAATMATVLGAALLRLARV